MTANDPRSVAVWLCFWITSTLSFADESVVRLEVREQAGRIGVSEILALDERSLTIRNDNGVGQVPRDGLLGLELSQPSSTSHPRFEILTTAGDVLRSDSVTVQDDQVRVVVGVGNGLTLTWPLEQVRQIDRLTGAVSSPAATNGDSGKSDDVVILRNGDTLTGEFLEMVEDAVRIRSNLGETTIAPDDLRSIRFSPDLLTVPMTPTSHAIVQLNEGSYLTVARITRAVGNSDWLVEIGGQENRIPSVAVRRIAFYGPEIVSLTQRASREERTTPFLPGVEPRKTSEVPMTGISKSRPVRIDNLPVPRTLSDIGRTVWEFSIEPADQELRTAVGLPDGIGSNGSCRFRIEVDGKSVYDSGVVRAADAMPAVPPVSVAGAGTVKLIIDYGEFWDIRNRGVWIDPRLIQGSGKGSTPAD